MASNKQQLQAGGYDCKWVTSPPDELLCLICLCVARDPHQHGNGGCGKVFCESCVTEYQKRGRTCPICRKNLTTFKDERSKGNNMYIYTTKSILLLTLKTSITSPFAHTQVHDTSKL